MFKKIIILTIFLFIFMGQNIFAQKIKVGIIERAPMVFKNNLGNWTGFSIDLLEEISKDNNIEYSLKDTSTFSELIKIVEEGEVDMSIANITITSDREVRMDFSQPIFDSGLQIITQKNGSKKSLFDIVLESGVLWFLLGALVLLLIIAHFIWFFERGTRSDRHDYFRDDYFGGLWDAFWWAFIIMTMGGFENEVPSSKFSRFLAMIWIMISLFFVSFLTAQITSSMTVAELNSDISSLEDLSGKKVGVMKSSSVVEFVKKEIGVSPVIFEKYEDFYRSLKDNKVDALIGDAPIVNYYVSKKAHKDFKIVGEIFKPEKYGILYPENSELKEKFDRSIIKLQENGKYQEIYNKYFKN